MALHAAAGRGEAELLAVPIARAQVEPGLAQPLDGEILEHMAEGEDAQRLAREAAVLVVRHLEVFVLQPAAAASPSRLPPR